MSTNHVTGVTAQATAKDQPVEVAKKEAPKAADPKPQKVQTPDKPQATGELSKEAGLDIGTMNIIASRQRGGQVETKRIRDVFIDLTADQVKMLKLSDETSYVTIDDTCYVLGDDAADIANIFGRNLRAPMNKGVIAAGELEAMAMLKIMVGEVLGDAPEGGVCTISSPGDPVDNDFDCLYHQAVVEDIVSSYGWEVETASESTAMAFSECADTTFTGLCISCGHGMTNVSLVFKTIETLKFSVARGGSWIDDQVAKVTGKTPSQICAIKEKGVNLLKPEGREAQAIAIYYKHLIRYAIKNFIQKFKELQGNIELPDEIPCVVAGGTSKAGGFVDLVKQAINQEHGFPFPISDVVHASDPLNSISKGLLIMSQNRNS